MQASKAFPTSIHSIAQTRTMRKFFTAQISNPGRRPPFYLVAEHLWGAGCNIDSDGNSRTPCDTEWTELTISQRDDSAAAIEVDPLSTEPLVLAVRSEDRELCRKAAQFIISSGGGTLSEDA
jgi:hypothetical protein